MLSDSARRLEDMWKVFGEYADPHFLVEAAGPRWWARFWEMYLFCALHDMGYDVSSDVAGPDVRCATPSGSVWLEATLPEMGTGPDGLAVPEMGRVYDVPQDRIILRYRAAVLEKTRKFRKYLSDRVVREDEPCIIAVNRAGIAIAGPDHIVPNGSSIPLFVRALLPIGHAFIEFNPTNSEVIRTGHKYSPSVAKSSGNSVATDIFADATHSDISAVLYATASPTMVPADLGSDFALVHNPYATAPLPRGFFPRGVEYWVVDSRLRWHDYGHELW